MRGVGLKVKGEGQKACNSNDLPGAIRNIKLHHSIFVHGCV